MKFKIFIPFILLFVLMGCGSSSSGNQPESSSSNSEEKLAIYIPLEQSKREETFSKIEKMRPTNINKLSRDIKEDAERDEIGERWRVYDGSSEDTSISIIYDDEKNSRVVELDGDGLQSGYVLGYSFATGSQWSNKKNRTIRWSASFCEDYYFYVRIRTLKGYRYLYYTASDYNYGVLEAYDVPHYIHHGLGTNSTDGTWRTFTRDLEADLKEFEPNNSMISIDGFFVRGSGLIDDIVLLKEESSDEDDDSSSVSIEDAVKSWLLKRDLNELWDNMAVSSDKTRAMVRGHKSRKRAATLFILDISNLEDIKELNHYIFGHKTAPSRTIIKDNDYMLAATAGEIFFYDYDTGKKLSRIKIGSPYSNRASYLLFQENRVIYSNYRTGKLQLVDFTDRTNPIISILYEGDKTTQYRLSDDESNVIVEDENNHIIKEIDISSLRRDI